MNNKEKVVKRTALLLFIISFSLSIKAQNHVERIFHVLTEDENLYTLSYMYNISVEDIKRANPNLPLTIQPHSVVAVPVPSINNATDSYHTILSGETFYGIAQRYNISLESLKKANPGISPLKIREGINLLIPKIDDRRSSPLSVINANTEHKGIANSNCREMHQVEKNETFYSIAQKFSVTVSQLSKANPDITPPLFKIHKGDFICIPFIQTETTPSQRDSTSVSKNSTPIHRIKVGVVLPFTNTNERIKGSVINYYRGLLMGASIVKKENISLDIYTFSFTNNDLNDSQLLRKMDVICGPYNSKGTTILNTISKEKQIPWFSPFKSTGAQVFHNPQAIIANAFNSYSDADEAHMYNRLFNQQNTIIIKGEKSEMNSDFYTLLSRFQEKGLNTVLSMDFQENELLKKVKKNKTNIILTNHIQKGLWKLLLKIKAFREVHPQIKIKIYGNADWMNMDAATLKVLRECETYIPLSPLGYLSPSMQKEFEAQCIKWFGHLPTFDSYEIQQGYISALFLFRQLANTGSVCRTSTSVYKDSDLNINLSRVCNWGGFVNRNKALFLLSPNQTTLIK